MKFWLKGLLIGLVVAILLQVGNVLGGLWCMGFYNGIDTSVVNNLICPPLTHTINFAGSIVLFPLWLILGVIIGWIYGKIKYKK